MKLFNLLLLNPDWAIFTLSLIIALVSLLSRIWILFDKKISSLETSYKLLLFNLKEEFEEGDKQILQEIKYNIQEKNQTLKDEIKNIHHLIENIETRLKDRTKYSQAKWTSLLLVIDNIQSYLATKHNYIIRNFPLGGLDDTLTSEEETLDTDFY